MKNNLHIISSPGNYSAKEKIYTELRKTEGRILSDEEVAQLPEVNKQNKFAYEWKIRKDSSEKLKKYITDNFIAPSILEVGCGNGWLSSKLAEIKNSKVTGIDLNLYELEQASRVFRKKENLMFYYLDIEKQKNPLADFDIIVLAASVQYFPSVAGIVNNLLPLLRKKGEIHSIDSHFYTGNELENARKRSAEYYSKSGFPAMTDYYFHHSVDDLEHYSPEYINRYPGYRLVSLLKPKSYLYFPWIKIKQQQPQ